MKKYTVTEYEIEDYNKLTDMTNEELVSSLEFIKRGYLPDYNFTGDECDFENARLHYAMMKAIKIIKHVDKS